MASTVSSCLYPENLALIQPATLPRRCCNLPERIRWLALCYYAGMSSACALAVVFGKVVEGMALVRKAEATGTQSGKPRQPVLIADSGEVCICHRCQFDYKHPE